MKRYKTLTTFLVLLLILIILGSFGLFIYFQFFKGKNVVNKFSDCINSGNPVLESYPRQCIDQASGKSFTEDITQNCIDQCGDGLCNEVTCQEVGCPCAEYPNNCPIDCLEADQTGLANPASTNCIDNGGTLEIRTDSKTKGQVGFCVFPDNTECEEWAFLRNECVKGQCIRECKNIGSRSEGYYNSCSGELIKWMKCAVD